MQYEKPCHIMWQSLLHTMFKNLTLLQNRALLCDAALHGSTCTETLRAHLAYRSFVAVLTSGFVPRSLYRLHFLTKSTLFTWRTFAFGGLFPMDTRSRKGFSVLAEEMWYIFYGCNLYTQLYSSSYKCMFLQMWLHLKQAFERYKIYWLKTLSQLKKKSIRHRFPYLLCLT